MNIESISILKFSLLKQSHVQPPSICPWARALVQGKVYYVLSNSIHVVAVVKQLWQKLFMNWSGQLHLLVLKLLRNGASSQVVYMGLSTEFLYDL